MPFYYLGFNAFQQFSNAPSECFGRVKHVEFYKCLDISWSKLAFISENGTLGINSYHYDGVEKSGCSNEYSVVKNFVKLSCTEKYLGAVTVDGVGKLYEFKEGSLKEIFKVIAGETNHFVECCIGDKDAVFINQAGKVVWISLVSPSLESQILPVAWKIVSVACGKEHVLLLSETNTVYSFGNGSRGQLGHDCLDSEASPRCVDCLEGLKVTNVATGGWHSAAVTVEGDLYTWGWNESGQLGFPTKQEVQDDDAIVLQATPACVQFPEDVIVQTISCGSRHTVVLADGGALWGFGWNSYGQLGSPFPPVSGKPTKIPFFATNGLKVSRIWGGGWSSLVETFSAANKGH